MKQRRQKVEERRNTHENNTSPWSFFILTFVLTWIFWIPLALSGQHVIVAEYGHGEFLALQPEASKRLLTSFFDTGAADTSLFTHQQVNFNAGLGYPAMAKIALAIVVLVIILLVALVCFIIRRGRRRRRRANQVPQ